MKTPVKVKFKFQIGFLFKVFNATSQQHFFFLIHCIFGGKKKKGMFEIYKSELQ